MEKKKLSFFEQYYSTDKLIEYTPHNEHASLARKREAMCLSHVDSFYPGIFLYVRMRTVDGKTLCPTCLVEMVDVDKMVNNYYRHEYDDRCDFWCRDCKKGVVLMRFKKFKSNNK